MCYAEPPTNGKVLIRTSVGPLEIELWGAEAPNAVRNFLSLVIDGFYDQMRFHRLVKEFLIQSGETSDVAKGTSFEQEIHPRLKFRYAGILGMANNKLGNKTSATQFFITLKKTDVLNGKYTVFGKVVGDSKHTLTKLTEVETDISDRPVDILNSPLIQFADVVVNPFPDIKQNIVPKRILEAQQRAIIMNGDRDDVRIQLKSRPNLLSIGRSLSDSEHSTIEEGLGGRRAGQDEVAMCAFQESDCELGDQQEPEEFEKTTEVETCEVKPIQHAGSISKVMQDFEARLAAMRADNDLDDQLAFVSHDLDFQQTQVPGIDSVSE